MPVVKYDIAGLYGAGDRSSQLPDKTLSYKDYLHYVGKDSK